MNVESDFTLLVPTFNRPEMLSRLLRFLASSNAQFKVRVLDSSLTSQRQRTQSEVEALGPRFAYVEYDETTNPFDKFADGVANTDTTYCQLCADDDIVFPEASLRCAQRLSLEPGLVAVRGRVIKFSLSQDAFDIPEIDPPPEELLHPEPLTRLWYFLRDYRALTYSVHRTDVLRHGLAVAGEMRSLMAREILSGAVAVVRGGVAAIGEVTNARELSSSGTYQNWHPFEWSVRSPAGVFTEYQRYRASLLAQFESGEAGQGEADLGLQLDRIHLYYLTSHLPADAYRFAVDQCFAGEEFESIWSLSRVQDSLADSEVAASQASASFRNRIYPVLWGLGRAVKRRFPGATRNLGNPLLKKVRRETRTYRVHPQLLRIHDASAKSVELDQLLTRLDAYIGA